MCFDTCCLHTAGVIFFSSQLSLISLVLRGRVFCIFVADSPASCSVVSPLTELNTTTAHITSTQCQTCAALLVQCARNNKRLLPEPVSNKTLYFFSLIMIAATVFPSSPPLSSPSHINDSLLSSARVQPHNHNVFTRPEMNRAIIISHANSADNDQTPSPVLLLLLLPSASPPALGSEQR